MGFYADGPAILGMCIALPALGILAVGGRFFIRKNYGQGLGADDWLMLLGLVFTIGQAISIIIGVEQQVIGYPTGDDELGELNYKFLILEEVFFAVDLINIIGLMFTKLSIVFFYRRVFHTGHNKPFNYFSLASIIFIASWGVAYFFAQLFQCGLNISIQWLGTYEETMLYCYNYAVFNVTYVATDLFQDLVVFIMPIPLILSLRMSVARRIAVLLIFCIGALTLVSSIIRVVFYGYIFTGRSSSLINNDPILNASISMYWTMLEMGLAVIVGCLPTFQIWFRKVTVDTVIKNVRGIFSVQSLSRKSSRASTQQKTREATSSETSLQRASFEMLSSKENGIKAEVTISIT